MNESDGQIDVKKSVLSKSSTQRINASKPLIELDLDDDSMDSLKEHDFMSEQERKEIRKHNALRKKRIAIKQQKQNAK